jgi:excinuclease UvrABC nuclease subunit
MIEVRRVIKQGVDFEYENLEPEVRCDGVYLLFDKYDNVIYIGQTSNIYTRLKAHLRNKNKDFSYAKVICVDNNNHRLTLEKLLIHYINPVNNIYDNTTNTKFNLDEEELNDMYKKTVKAKEKYSQLYHHLHQVIVDKRMTKKDVVTLQKLTNKLYGEIYCLQSNILKYLNFSTLNSKNYERLD